MKALALLLALALAAPPAPPLPGYEEHTKKELWETAVRFEGKADVALLRLGGCQEQLKVRTATVVQAIAAGYAPREGFSTGELVGWIAASAGVGILIGVFLIAPKLKDAPAVVVVGGSP